MTLTEQQVQSYHALVQARNGQPVLLRQAFAEWSQWLKTGFAGQTAFYYPTKLRPWIQKQEGRAVHEVTAKEVDRWVNAAGLALTTRNARLAILRNFYRFMGHKHWLVEDTAALVRVNHNTLSHDQKERRGVAPFTDEEFQRLTDHLAGLIMGHREYLHAGIVNGYKSHWVDEQERRFQGHRFWYFASIISRCTGLRFGDVCQLETACLKEPDFTVWTDKRNRRVQPHILRRPLWDETVGQMPIDGQYVFPAECRRYRDDLERARLVKEFGHLCRTLGIRKGFHGLRAAYATECQEQGIAIEKIGGYLGHARTETTKNYLPQ